MKKVRFFGWKEGMRKILFTKLLYEKGELSLKKSKNVCDGILDEKEYIIDFKDEDTAKFILKKSIEYHVKCELTN